MIKKKKTFLEVKICSPEQGSAEIESKQFRFMGHKVSVTTTQFCHYNAKAAIDSMPMNGHSCVAIKLYL